MGFVFSRVSEAEYFNCGGAAMLRIVEFLMIVYVEKRSQEIIYGKAVESFPFGKIDAG